MGAWARIFLVCLVIGAVDASPLAAQVAAQPGESLIVTMDRGGRLIPRLEQVRGLRASGQRVEIHGPDCFSACTLYLGLEDVCVHPAVRFGFHGPSHFGKPLSASSFEKWSMEMADHYPPKLRAWFMKTGRHRLEGHYLIMGRDLIRLGVAACSGVSESAAGAAAPTGSAKSNSGSPNTEQRR